LVALLTLLGTLVFLGPLAETLRSHPLEEAYYSWLIGSTEGAVAKGLPRYPHGPLPLPAMNALASWGSGRSPHKVALLPKSLATERVYARYRRAGAQGRLPEVSTEDDADLVVVVHDDADPAYYDLAKDVAGSVPPEDSVVLRSGTVRLITVGAFGRVRPLELGPALEGEH
jgi:hypothetical protein